MLRAAIVATAVLLGFFATPAMAAATCGGQSFEVVKHGVWRDGNTAFCIGGSAKAFQSGGRFAILRPRENRLYWFTGTRRGNTIYGSNIPNIPRRSTDGTFTGRVDFSDTGSVTWHWVDRNRRYPGRLR